MHNNQAIFELLFKRNFSDPGNKQFLEQLTISHPYFSPAQFYLLQQIKDGSEAHKKQAAKTSLLFNNPHWLNFQLQQTRQLAPVKEEYIVESKHEAGNDTENMEEAMIEKEIEPIKIEVKDEIDDTENIEEALIEKEIEPIKIEIKDEVPDDTENMEEEMTEKEIEPIKIEIKDEVPDDTENMEDEMIEKEIEPMKIELKLPAEKNTMDEIPLFEPMHMVDYFASQGIKLNETQASDKLGKQLKSFTEWLKTMKKVHVENHGPAAEQTDTNIQALAEKSNAEDEVLTVSMADVFAKQGKIDKALEVLKKLSLLNPAKSAYFAAKIEHLKGL